MNTGEMKVLSIGGTPRERGRAIGESLRDDINTVLAKYRSSVEPGRGYSANKYFMALDAYSQHLAAAQKWTPGLVEEIWGLAEGASIAKEDAFRLQLLDEDWFFDAYHYATRPEVRDKCTAFGIVGDSTYAGQNMDIPSLVDGHQVLLRIEYPDSDLESLIFTYAGMNCLVGMNNSPLGVTCNTLMQLGGCADGLPVSFIARTILEKTSFDEAAVFLKSVKHASGQNYLLSTRGQVGSFECSPNQVTEYKPREDGSRVCHTNHPLANDDTDSFEALKKSHPDGGWARDDNTRSRFSSIASRTLDCADTPGLDELKAALAAKDDPSHPVCRDYSTNTEASVIAFTAGSMIYEYAEESSFHLAAGPPSESEFLTFLFSKQFDGQSEN
jgi:predicted choloylglycine hydrolase